MDSMTPSVTPMTDGQIDKAVATYRALLTKHRTELGSDAAQQVLGDHAYVAEQIAVLRKRIEAISNMIARCVAVNRDRSAKEAFKATKRNEYLTDDVVTVMPQGEGDEISVVFFKLGRYITDADLEKEYELRGLKPADPFALAAVNEADPSFADDYPNSTHWKDEKGNWCYAAFDRWRDARYVSVYRDDNRWSGRWGFAGSRK